MKHRKPNLYSTSLDTTVAADSSFVTDALTDNSTPRNNSLNDVETVEDTTDYSETTRSE